ncbi:apolipoprotein N-acyltransferase [Nocardia colli]|uniref:Apolipoprotein N-acyltransferase n=1 Tax=Nocardia colli TaxID=2545717 RepID=A0A5N0EBA3_9NOCA|nr:apolipoprotein N-acyltransferase [Nocardia colli]KAA8886070.1 apolipoprotein N-acyltransferase [Nocardia colli]
MGRRPLVVRERLSAVVSRYPVLWRSVAAIVAGLLLFGSFPPRPWWFLAPVGITVLTLIVRDCGRLRSGFGYGFLAGLAFFVPLLPWTGIYVGPVPWLALSTVCAVYIGLFGLMSRLVGRLPGWPLWVALAWATAEWVRSSFPFGGFPWGRLAFGQADGWFLSLASIGGAPMVSFAVALTGTGAAALILAVRSARAGASATTPVSSDGVGQKPHGAASTEDASMRGSAAESVDNPSAAADRDSSDARRAVADQRRASTPRTAFATAAAALIIMPIAGLLLSTTLPDPDQGDRTITVAAIQGSVPRLGLDFNAQRRAVLDNHVRRTKELARAVEAGQAKKPDVVIWPENSSDIDPLRNADAAAIITEASEQIGAPILVGAVLVNSDRTTTNSVIVWNGAAGPGERHDKKIIQPFGEYLPMRSFFRLFSEYADRAGYFVPGHGDGVVRADGVDIGVATCYEVAFDRAFEDAMRAGAQLLTVPTNNATFGDSEMTYQQLAMSRIRAVEHGRALVVAATSGVSAIIAADGSVEQETPQFIPAALVADLPLRTSNTVATRVGPAPERVFVALTVAALVAGVVVRRRRSRTEETTDRNAEIGQSVS